MEFPGASRGRRFLVSSVVRHAGAGRTSGFLRQVELDRGPGRRGPGRRVRRCAVPESVYRGRDPNPRGGQRGLRGVAVHGERVVVANAERIMVFDPSWRPVAELSHPLLGGIHDLLPDDGGIWATSTSADLLVRLDWRGELAEVWEWRRDRRLVRALGFRRLPPVDRGRDYRDPRSSRSGVPNAAHLNGVARDGAGLLLSLGRVLSPAVYRRQRLAGIAGWIAAALGLPPRSPRPPRPGAPPAGRRPGSTAAVVRLGADRRAELLHRVTGVEVPNHDALRLGDRLIYNDSNRSRLVAQPLGGADGEVAVDVPGDPGFVRGLAHLDGGELLVGNQAPLALYRVDLDRRRVVERILLDGEPGESTYGVCELPDLFDDLPEKLPAEPG